MMKGPEIGISKLYMEEENEVRPAEMFILLSKSLGIATAPWKGS